MSKTRVVNLRKNPYDIYIGRGSKWGNPYRIGVHGTRKEVITLYARHIMSRADLLESLPELRGKILGCYCKPLPCHGDILVKLLEEKK